MARRSKALKKSKRFVKEKARREKEYRASNKVVHHKHEDIVLPNRGDHNWYVIRLVSLSLTTTDFTNTSPHKNAGSPHRLNLRSCLAKKHVGFCGICGALCSLLHGCPRHHSEGAKGDNLFSEDNEELRAMVKENRERGLFDPSRKLLVTYEKGRVIACVDREGNPVGESVEDSLDRIQPLDTSAEWETGEWETTRKWFECWFEPRYTEVCYEIECNLERKLVKLGYTSSDLDLGVKQKFSTLTPLAVGTNWFCLLEKMVSAYKQARTEVCVGTIS